MTVKMIDIYIDCPEGHLSEYTMTTGANTTQIACKTCGAKWAIKTDFYLKHDKTEAVTLMRAWRPDGSLVSGVEYPLLFVKRKQ